MDLHDHGRVEPGELLEESWFFGNLLHGKSRMWRSSCQSDPCCPTSPEKSMEETYSAIKKIPEGRRGSLSRAAGPGLMKTTSMPSNVRDNKESPARIISPMKQQMQCGYLLRAPSLPTFAEKEEFQDDESEFSMGKLIRQASLNHAKVQPPPLPTVKGDLTRSFSISTIPKQQKVTNHASTRMSLYDHRTGELQRLNKNLSLKLEERRTVGTRDEEKVIRRPIKSCGILPTPFQNGAAAQKSAQDMKAQIKFWARAVASNVRQEC